MLAGNRMVSINKRNKHRNVTTALFFSLFFCIVVIIPVSAITNSWQIMTVDSGGIIGQYTSLALDSSDYPAISYYDFSNKDLKYAKWDGLAWIPETVDSSGYDVGKYSSLALDASGIPRISYYNASSGEVIYASQDSGSWITEKVDPTGGAGGYTSLALDASDNPHVSYSHTAPALKFAWWTGSFWNHESVDSAGIVGQYNSLALDGSDKPRIAYYDATNGDLKYAAWDSSSWSIETVHSAGDVGQYLSLNLTPSGEPRISYFDNTAKILKYAWYGTPVVADFTATPNTGNVPLTVQFNDISMGNPAPISRTWDFNNDGIIDSTAPNPPYLYTTGGTYTISLTASGTYGASTKQLTITLTEPTPTPTPTPTPEQSTDTSDLSVSAPLATPVQELSIATEPVNVGGNSAIEKANVTGKGVSEMVVTAMLLSTLPSGVPSVVDPVYQYIDVTPAHFTTISLAVIEFGVPLSWIEEQHTTPASIALARFQDGAWTNLPTTLIREANGHAYFRAESPGFSIFAIVAVKGSVIAASAAQATEVTTEQITVPATSVAVPVTTTIKPPRTSTTPPTTPTSPQQQSMTILLPLLGAGTALLLRRLK